MGRLQAAYSIEAGAAFILLLIDQGAADEFLAQQLLPNIA
jgi:hypothetical protein